METTAIQEGSISLEKSLLSFRSGINGNLPGFFLRSRKNQLRRFYHLEAELMETSSKSPKS
ncbi:hypothetical protein [Nostoc sp.]|uniref:hypothetical protein n=1 Tax=Nostoc sp. TaxID=1180 RepID=UPI003FA60890